MPTRKSDALAAMLPRVSSLLVGPWAVLRQLASRMHAPPPTPLPLLLADAAAPAAAPRSRGALDALADVLRDGFLWMAVPKKKVSYTRKRKRSAGFQAIRGQKLQTHVYMCPVCERNRMPHRVCDREDCSTYYKNKWF